MTSVITKKTSYFNLDRDLTHSQRHLLLAPETNIPNK